MIHSKRTFFLCCLIWGATCAFGQLKISILRSTPADDLYNPRSMLIKNDFYDSDLNPKGKGFKNSFEIQKDSLVIFDKNALLMWQLTSSATSMTYDEAEDTLSTMNAKRYAGFSDWRLPTLEEAMSLLEPTQNDSGYFIDAAFVQQRFSIWTSDKLNVRNGLGSVIASPRWTVDFFQGKSFWEVLPGGSRHSPRASVRGVRSVIR